MTIERLDNELRPECCPVQGGQEHVDTRSNFEGWHISMGGALGYDPTP
jgi:hypothetical protein